MFKTLHASDVTLTRLCRHILAFWQNLTFGGNSHTVDFSFLDKENHTLLKTKWYSHHIHVLPITTQWLWHDVQLTEDAHRLAGRVCWRLGQQSSAGSLWLKVVSRFAEIRVLRQEASSNTTQEEPRTCNGASAENSFWQHQERSKNLHLAEKSADNSLPDCPSHAVQWACCLDENLPCSFPTGLGQNENLKLLFSMDRAVRAWIFLLHNY